MLVDPAEVFVRVPGAEVAHRIANLLVGIDWGMVFFRSCRWIGFEARAWINLPLSHARNQSVQACQSGRDTVSRF